MPSRLLLLLILTACGAKPPEAPPPPPGPVVARVVATLDEATRLDRDRRHPEAIAAWRRAHAAFERDLEPTLRAQWSDVEIAETEYLFGRVRSELDQARGRPGPVVRALEERLKAQVAPPD